MFYTFLIISHVPFLGGNFCVLVNFRFYRFFLDFLFLDLLWIIR